MQTPPLPLPPRPPRQKDWFDRNLLWLIPAIILFGILALCGFGFMLLGLFKSSDAYQGALTRIQTSPTAIEALGSPITDNLLFTGSIHLNNSAGHADLQIGVKGNRSKGTAYVIADRSRGQWHFTQIIVVLHDSDQRIDLSDPEKPKLDQPLER
ncbi:cytochrome c oxidase assembly factor Coa1 family protein [Rariglobus hedericola]|uniref:Cytochrome oxidase complex assembly protein 1 n=1 Tax=Rariglobus hedericola TaxID=2597822 RepID=A0A556QM87_9BACT|nr:cytochrome c oxidase assembly factor Coa1 family protein [Rariglobus hedericola]TSJ77754.1 hypothetical protein FPL22_00140 [Rariglobus hedericola]